MRWFGHVIAMKENFFVMIAYDPGLRESVAGDNTRERITSR